MNMQALRFIIADSEVPDQAQDFTLRADLYFAVAFCFEIEPADCRCLKGAERRQRRTLQSLRDCETSD
jgi:hypothetical protein